MTGGARSDDVVSGIRRALVTAQSKLLEAQRKLQASADALHERLGRK